MLFNKGQHDFPDCHHSVNAGARSIGKIIAIFLKIGYPKYEFPMFELAVIS